MRAKDQVWSDENESDNDADPRAERPERAASLRPQRQEASPEVRQTSSTPVTVEAAEETGHASLLLCVHVIEAFFAALACTDTPMNALVAPASANEESQVRLPPPSAEDQAPPVVHEAGRAESQPGAALAAFALGSVVFYQQDRAARRPDREEERNNRLAAEKH